MAESVVEFVDVVKDYPCSWLGRQKLRAVDGVSLQVQAGEVFGLLGPNRAGKTTLVKLLLSLCRTTAGQVQRLGQPHTNRSTLARVGYVHENHAFPPYLTATGLLEFYGALSLLPESEVRERLSMLLEKVGLADRADEPIQRFSKGMVQRLGIAQALINDPELLVLDEPSEGLDLNGRQLIRDLTAAQRKRGRTVLLVTHLLSEVEHLCDRLAVMVGGRVAFVGTVNELKRNPRTGAPCSLETALGEIYQKQ